jgi:hypothetical protein
MSYNSGTMVIKKDHSLLNCIATSMLAYFCSVPVHELFHLLTTYAYGDKCEWYSAGAVKEMHTFDYMTLAPFHRIMIAGGSASILNAIIGVVLFIILLKATGIGSLMRVFLTQLMGAQLTLGFGYFLIGGLFGFGDWGNVYSYFPDNPGLVTVMHIILAVVGSAGVVFIFFALNYMSYYYIKDPADKAERCRVAARLHMTMFIVGIIAGPLATIPSPAVKEGHLSLGISLLLDLMWIPFFWGFMFTWVMVKPPKQGRFLYHLPADPRYVLLIIGIILMAINQFIFGPGIRIN